MTAWLKGREEKRGHKTVYPHWQQGASAKPTSDLLNCWYYQQNPHKKLLIKVVLSCCFEKCDLLWVRNTHSSFFEAINSLGEIFCNCYSLMYLIICQRERPKLWFWAFGIPSFFSLEMIFNTKTKIQYKCNSFPLVLWRNLIFIVGVG